MKYCEQCGKELKKGVEYCPNCGAKVNKDDKEVVNASVVDNNTNTTVKDNTTIAFVCSIIGALCCTYVAIPGMILSIQSLKQIEIVNLINNLQLVLIENLLAILI